MRMLLGARASADEMLVTALPLPWLLPGQLILNKFRNKDTIYESKKPCQSDII